MIDSEMGEGKYEGEGKEKREEERDDEAMPSISEEQLAELK